MAAAKSTSDRPRDPEPSDADLAGVQIAANLARLRAMERFSSDPSALPQRAGPPLQNLVSPQQRLDFAAAKKAEIDNNLRWLYGVLLLVLLIAMLTAADWIFFKYLQGNHWKVATPTINIWLGATVVQVIGVVVIVVNYLFPSALIKRSDQNLRSGQSAEDG